MNELKQLIREYPELGDVFADFETRLLFLENSLPNIPYDETSTQSPDSTTLKEEPWSKKQWDAVQQLQAQLLHISNKINEMRANASKRKKTKY